MFSGFYQGKRVLVTGHTGFKGGWLSLWLKQLGAEVLGYALAAPTGPNFYDIIRNDIFAREEIADIRDGEKLEHSISSFRPDLIFHLAAQPLVRLSYERPVETFETNVIGTIKLLEAVRKLRSEATVIVVTSDKCYENQNWEFGYRENDPLGGHDVYSSSKAACEIVVQAWQRSFFHARTQVVSARAGNVFGGGDYAADRIVPDAIRALISQVPISVRNPNATRPWQHVLDCLSGYLWLGTRVECAGADFPKAFNFGPGVQANFSVSKLTEEILKIWPGEWKSTGTSGQPHEAHQLNLAIDRAATVLEWFPTWSFSEAVQNTVSWYYERHVKAEKMLNYSVRQIEIFEQAARSKGNRWALGGAK